MLAGCFGGLGLWDGGTGDAEALHRPGVGGGLEALTMHCCFVLGHRDCFSLGTAGKVARGSTN